MKIVYAKLFMTEYNRSSSPEFPKTSKVVGIRIYTDEGIYGDGEVAGIHATHGAFGLIKDMWPLIVGRDPFENEVLWDQLMLRTFWGQNGGAFWYSAVSAIDLALWDIKSKALGVPLHKLLGGKRRDRVRCYASQLQFGWGPADSPAVTVQDYVDRANLALADGYDAIKIDFLNWDDKGRILNETDRLGLLPPELVQTFSDRVPAVREALGPSVDLIIENHAGT
ncbi:MAG: mandelate racemase/muconate lactonizing enzyme family protein, partial [Oscillospiraceae bacterium]|nr:mandelate racemase/muconate lactonizing enzyme family protein [Oscillospiraceae bacterium]